MNRPDLDEGFLTVAGAAEAEIRVRASKFIAIAAPVTDEAEARDLLDRRSRAFHDATHNCAAWRFRDGGWRALDAGEPSGSAGSPILAAIDGAGLVDTAVVVTRYFGGTKLGVGGLARAYGDAAAAAIARAPRRRGIPAARLAIRYGYDDTSAVMRCIERVAAADVEHDYSATGGPVVSLTVPASAVDTLDRLLREATAGRVIPERSSDTVLYAPA